MPPSDTETVIVAAPPDTARTAPRPDTGRTAPRPDTVRAGQPAAEGRYRVQITAVRDVSTARSVAAKLKIKGFLSVVTVEEGGLYKVRVGNYATKAEAIAALPGIKARLGGSPFVVSES